jgi:D-sedoheptulose 7-phosphate isomerase
MNVLAQLFEASKSPADYAAGYLGRIAELLKQIDVASVEKATAKIEETARQGKTIYCIANGGSAAVASHFVNDLSANSVSDGQTGIRSFSLADNVESITAIANDVGFEHVFLYQLRANLQPGDVVIAMSVSGNSPNILNAVRYAKEHGAYTVGWCGFEGGALAKLCDLAIHVPSTRDEYGPVEAIFSHLSHIISGYVTMKRGKKLHH